MPNGVISENTEPNSSSSSWQWIGIDGLSWIGLKWGMPLSSQPCCYLARCCGRGRQTSTLATKRKTPSSTSTFAHRLVPFVKPNCSQRALLVHARNGLRSCRRIMSAWQLLQQGRDVYALCFMPGVCNNTQQLR